MNLSIKNTLALGAAGLSIFILASESKAQTTIPATGFVKDFSTVVSGKNPSFGAGATTLGVGYDPSGGQGKLAISSNSATAQSVYEAFNFTSSAAGTFTTITTGSQAQIQIYSTDENSNTDITGANLPFNLYAELYQYDPNAVSGTVPVTGADLFGTPQKITISTLGGTVTGGGFYSGTFTTTGDILAGSSYVLGITTLNSDTQDFATVSRSPFSISGIATGDQTFDKSQYLTDTGDQGVPTQTGIIPITNANNVVAFSLLTQPSAAPEPSQWGGIAFTGIGVAFLAYKRRRAMTSLSTQE